MLYPLVSIFRLNRFVQLHVLFAILFLGSQRYAVAQFNDLGVHGIWFDGEITLNDLTSLKGYVQYNDKLGLIKFKASQEDDERSFTDKRILQMEFFDTQKSTYRKFATFNLKATDSGWEGSLLFEIVMEFRDFAVLSRRFPADPALRNVGDFYNPKIVNIGYDLTEQICVAGTDGEVGLVLQTTDTELVGSKPLIHRKVKPVLFAGVMIKYMGIKWKHVRTFVKANKLKLTEREDLMSAFAYYEQLIQEEE
ncbi:MAG TPA: hypothetical protein VD884_21310 [Ohtaekwangia sp.]|nr:hypothetical protein [Ohtaekwangia sp.]